MHTLSFGRVALVFVLLLLSACNYGTTRNTPAATAGSEKRQLGNSAVDSLAKKEFMPGSVKVTKAWIQPAAVKHVTGDVGSDATLQPEKAQGGGVVAHRSLLSSQYLFAVR